MINVGSGQEISIGDLAQQIAVLTGMPLQILSDEERLRPEASEVERLCAANSRAREMLGWGPRVPLAEGLAHTIEWFRSHLDFYRPDSYRL